MISSDAPRVTVLMTVYNGSEFLAESVQSILDQTFHDFELIVVDDGSRDGSAAVVRSFEDHRVRLAANGQNIGQTPSLNRGLALASGEFIARQDADDLSEPHRLARQVEFLDAHPDVALVGSWYREIDQRGDVGKERRLPSDTVALRWAMRFFCPLVHTGAMWRREQVAREVGEYDERFRAAQDYDFWMRIADRFPVANVPEPLVRYRVHPSSLTSTYDGVTREFQEIGVAGMARTLGWPEADGATQRHRFDAMSSLLYGPWHDWTGDELARASDDLAALDEWFREHFALTDAERARHRADVTGRMRRTLLRQGLRFVRRGPRSQAWRTLHRAMNPL